MDTHQRVIWEGHKNGIRAVVTRQPTSLTARPIYEVEMWQRPRWGAAYCKVIDPKLKVAFRAARAAMKSPL